MKLKIKVNKPDLLVIHDNNISIWLVGLCFICSGSFVLFLGPSASKNFTFWPHLAVIFIGVSHLIGGVITIRSAPSTLTTLSIDKNRLTHIVAGPFNRTVVTEKPLTDLYSATLDTHQDGQYHQVANIWLNITSGPKLYLAYHPLLDVQKVTNVHGQIQDWLKEMAHPSPRLH